MRKYVDNEFGQLKKITLQEYCADLELMTERYNGSRMYKCGDKTVMVLTAIDEIVSIVTEIILQQDGFFSELKAAPSNLFMAKYNGNYAFARTAGKAIDTLRDKLPSKRMKVNRMDSATHRVTCI